MYDDHTDTMSIIAIIHMMTTLLFVGNFLGRDLGVVGATVGRLVAPIIVGATVGGRFVPIIVGTTVAPIVTGGRVVGVTVAPIVDVGEIINGVELILVVFDIYLYKIYL